MPQNIGEVCKNVNVLDGIPSIIEPYTSLDDSQLQAIHRILTKELGIIQGPAKRARITKRVMGDAMAPKRSEKNQGSGTTCPYLSDDELTGRWRWSLTRRISAMESAHYDREHDPNSQHVQDIEKDPSLTLL